MKKVTAFFSMLALGLTSTFVSCVHKVNAVKSETDRTPASIEEVNYDEHHSKLIEQKYNEKVEK